jgi:flagella basal body P-ring formation protein FlgA
MSPDKGNTAMTLKIKLTMLTSMILAFLFLGGSAACALEIRVKEHATVRGETIHLGDIATFSPAGDGRVTLLKGIEISSAPPPGKMVTLNNQLLIYKIGPTLGGMKDVGLKIPETLSVDREAQTVSVEQLGAIFKKYVLENIPSPCKEIQFERITVQGPVQLPLGEMRWEVKNRREGDYSGDVSLLVSFWVDGKVVRKIPLGGRISFKQAVVKAVKMIKVGEMIDKNDVVSSVERNPETRTDALARVEEAVGKRATRTIQADQVVTSKMVETPPAVQKGDRVLIRAQHDRIKITTFGRVLEDGRAGDQVKVVNVSSGKEIWATVMSPGQVSVSF